MFHVLKTVNLLLPHPVYTLLSGSEGDQFSTDTITLLFHSKRQVSGLYVFCIDRSTTNVDKEHASQTCVTTPAKSGTSLHTVDKLV